MKITLSLLTLAIAGVLTFFSFNSEKEQLQKTTTETVQKANEVSTEGDIEGDTFSIVAYDPVTGEFGGAGTSCVGFQIDFLNEIIVDNSGEMIGAIHVQAAAQTGNANIAKARMLAGDNPSQIITYLENNDCCGDADASSRQYGIVGFNNINDYSDLTTSGFTGATNGVYGNHITGPNYSIQGNILDEELGQIILENMETAFVNTDGSLAEKLMAALQGAKRVGADKRCGPDGDGEFGTSNQYNSGRASFIRVRRPSDTGVNNNEGTNNFIDISVGPVGQFVEPIDVLQCAFDAAFNITDATCRQTVDTFPYVMDFETTTWEQESSCAIANAWIRSEFATPSGGTGPNASNQGDMYTYYEASDLNNGGFETTGYIASPCFVIAEDKAATITFDYHMYSTEEGGVTGTLALEANDGSGWTEIWSETGNKGVEWQEDESVSLVAYTGTTVKLRFKAAASNSFRNDFGLDDIQITLEDFCNNVVTYNGGTLETTDFRDTVTIREDYNTADGSFDACTLVVTNNATLTIAAGTYANIRSNVTVDAGSQIIIEHEGSLVQTLESAQVTNNGTINVNMTTPTINAREFMILGSPMTNQSETVYDAYQVLSHDTDNYTMFTSEVIDGINFYDEEADELTPFVGALNPAEGYIVRPSFTEDGTYDYTFDGGTLNTGNITYEAGFNGNKDDSANLIANPYPSAIDANLFLAENSGIISEIYFWESLTPPGAINGPYGEQNFSMEDISTYNNMGGTAAAANGGGIPNNIIATGQGFGIKANAGGTVTFTNAMRVTSGNTTLRSPLTDADRFWLSITESENRNSSTNLIGFTSAATPGLDFGFDTEKMGTNVSLYTHLEDGSERLSIQSREAFDANIKIPMGFSSYHEEELTYTISIANMEGNLISDATIYLFDSVTNITTNLNEGNYAFLSTGGTYDSRFTILFENEEVLSTEETIVSSVAIYPNPTTGSLQLQTGNSNIIGAVVFDLQGRKVKEVSFDATTNAQLDITSFTSGVYLINVETTNGMITKKVIKK